MSFRILDIILVFLSKTNFRTEFLRTANKVRPKKQKIYLSSCPQEDLNGFRLKSLADSEKQGQNDLKIFYQKFGIMSRTKIKINNTQVQNVKKA
jgi:hypothetical protein